jgi:hypothetical protein
MLYDSASNQRLPCLYICPVANVLVCSPFILCLSAAIVIPLFHSALRTIGVLEASADTQQVRGNGSRLYEDQRNEVNIWMWHYCRGCPLMVSMAEAERIRCKRISESRTRGPGSRD